MKAIFTLRHYCRRNVLLERGPEETKIIYSEPRSATTKYKLLAEPPMAVFKDRGHNWAFAVSSYENYRNEVAH